MLVLQLLESGLQNFVMEILTLKTTHVQVLKNRLKMKNFKLYLKKTHVKLKKNLDNS